MVSSDIAFFMSVLLHVVLASCPSWPCRPSTAPWFQTSFRTCLFPSSCRACPYCRLEAPGRCCSAQRLCCLGGRNQHLLRRSLRSVRSGRDNARRNTVSLYKILKLLTNILRCAEDNGGAIGIVEAWNRPGRAPDEPVA